MIQAVNIGLLHVTLPVVRTWLYLLWKQLFAAGSVIEVKQKLCEQKSLYRVPTLARTSDRCWNGVGVTVTFQCMTQFHFLLSCDNVLKFDWYCQISGSRSNSLNLWKLPGHFSYGLGTRLDIKGYINSWVQWRTWRDSEYTIVMVMFHWPPIWCTHIPTFYLPNTHIHTHTPSPYHPHSSHLPSPSLTNPSPFPHSPPSYSPPSHAHTPPSCPHTSHPLPLTSPSPPHTPPLPLISPFPHTLHPPPHPTLPPHTSHPLPLTYLTLPSSHTPPSAFHIPTDVQITYLFPKDYVWDDDLKKQLPKFSFPSMRRWVYKTNVWVLQNRAGSSRCIAHDDIISSCMHNSAITTEIMEITGDYWRLLEITGDY